MLVLGTDTYITADAATTYVAAYVKNGVAPSEVALRQATVAIDRLYFGRFVCAPTLAGQPLAFPRCGETTIPVGVAQATAELAVLIDAGTVDPYGQPAGAIVETSFEIEGISQKTKYSDGHQTNELHKIDMILAPYLRAADEVPCGMSWVSVVPLL